MTAKPRPDTLDCHLAPSIFHQPWWMAISCNQQFGEAYVRQGGTIAARLPYAVKQRLPGLRVIGQPMLSYVLGPGFSRQYSQSGPPRSAKQLSITKELIEQLPRASHVSFRLHGDSTNTIAFNMAGFKTSVEFTVEVPPSDPTAMWEGMRGKTRNLIRRAQERFDTSTSLEPSAFTEFYHANLWASGVRRSLYDMDVCLAVIKAAIARQVGRVWTARDATGAAAAAVFCVWDEQRCYYLLSTRKAGSDAGATNLLLWKAIRQASENGRTFDMCGIHVRSGTAANLHLLGGFGGEIKPRFVVSRAAPVVRFMRSVAIRLQTSAYIRPSSRHGAYHFGPTTGRGSRSIAERA